MRCKLTVDPRRSVRPIVMWYLIYNRQRKMQPKQKLRNRRPFQNRTPENGSESETINISNTEIKINVHNNPLKCHSCLWRVLGTILYKDICPEVSYSRCRFRIVTIHIQTYWLVIQVFSAGNCAIRPKSTIFHSLS